MTKPLDHHTFIRIIRRAKSGPGLDSLETARRDRELLIAEVRRLRFAMNEAKCRALVAEGEAEEREEDLQQVMPRVQGVRFACLDCGCNVFTRRGDKYHCNGCSAVYRGE